MQAVRVRTEAGWLCLASDATHYYENIWTGVPFPIVVDVEDTLNGYKTLERLASSRELIVPGHDPLVTELFPKIDGADIYRLDRGLVKAFPF
jgi:glyoxylase-like metal-dependent hydrolase (beta-lactamase superfamily II)